LLFVMYVINIIDRHIINILVEPIKRDLVLTDTQMGFLTGFAFAIFYTTLGVPIAVLADRYSRARLIAACSAMWSLMTAATGAAQSYFTAAVSRMGVGVGEAGLTPAATSLIADLFPPEQRGKALGIYASAVPIGTMLAGLLGGWLADTIGWRNTFKALGAVGLLFTLFFLVTFKEPLRGAGDGVVAGDVTKRHTIVETVQFMLQSRSCWHFLGAFAMFGLVGAAINNWTPAFFMRTHDLTLMQMAASIGAIFGIGGAVGMIAGGFVADRAATRDVSAYLRMPAVALLVTLPLYVAVYLSPSAMLAGTLLVVPVITTAVILPPVLALLQRLVKPNMRAVSVAAFLLVLHLAGMGGGPLVVGALSDFLQPVAGSDSLRYALLCVIPLNGIAVWLFWRGSRYVKADIDRVAALP
jgi:MFS family permease